MRNKEQIEKSRARCRAYYQKNKKRCSERKKAWIAENREHYLQMEKQRYRRLCQDPSFRIAERERIKSYILRNPERFKQMAKVRRKTYLKNLSGARLENYKASQKLWQTSNRKTLAQRACLAYQLDKAKILASNKISYEKHHGNYYKKNKRKILSKQRILREKKGREFWSDYHAAYRKKNLAKFLERERRARTNPRYAAVSRSSSAKRRALKKGCSVSQSAAIKRFYKLVCEAYYMECHWCKKPVRQCRREVDHRIPLSRGGKHTRSNLVCSCRGCNRTKHAKLPSEFRKLQKRIAKPYN